MNNAMQQLCSHASQLALEWRGSDRTVEQKKLTESCIAERKWKVTKGANGVRLNTSSSYSVAHRPSRKGSIEEPVRESTGFILNGAVNTGSVPNKTLRPLSPLLTTPHHSSPAKIARKTAKARE